MAARFVTPLGKFTNLHLRCELLLCDPAGVQTQNLQNRNLTLYSVELRGRSPLQDTKLSSISA